jgi:hypothetical protein
MTDIPASKRNNAGGYRSYPKKGIPSGSIVYFWAKRRSLLLRTNPRTARKEWVNCLCGKERI